MHFTSNDHRSKLKGDPVTATPTMATTYDVRKNASIYRDATQTQVRCNYYEVHGFRLKHVYIANSQIIRFILNSLLLNTYGKQYVQCPMHIVLGMPVCGMSQSTSRHDKEKIVDEYPRI